MATQILCPYNIDPLIHADQDLTLNENQIPITEKSDAISIRMEMEIIASLSLRYYSTYST